MQTTAVEDIALHPKAAKNLSDIGVGDKVAVKAHHHGDEPFMILTVDKVTASQFSTANGRRFVKSTGKEVASSRPYPDYAIIVDEVYIAALEVYVEEKREERKIRLWLYTMGQEQKKVPLAAIQAMKAAYDGWLETQGETES